MYVLFLQTHCHIKQSLNHLNNNSIQMEYTAKILMPIFGKQKSSRTTRLTESIVNFWRIQGALWRNHKSDSKKKDTSIVY